MAEWGSALWGLGGVWGSQPLEDITVISPRLISVDNILDGYLTVRFSEPMTQDDAFRAIANFHVTPNPDSLTMELLEVTTDVSQPDTAMIKFTGGGGDYLMTAVGVYDVDGNVLDPDYDTVPFDITMPSDDVKPVIHMFDTIWGPLGISQRVIARRTIEQTVVNRSIDVAVSKQLSNRMKAIGAASPVRSGKDGANR